MKVTITSFAAGEDGIRRLRDTVFGAEQQVPRELDWDGQDPACVQVLASDEAGNPIGTGRLQPDGRIGRLCVLAPWRGRGVGGRMLEALAAAAADRGLNEVYLHAQVTALPFYEKHGFTPDGPRFMEAGIQHLNMTRPTRLEGREVR